MRSLLTLVIVAFSTLPAIADSSAATLSTATIYTSGDGGYHTYRIPSIAVTNAGTVLALCEGRKKSRSDTGDIDLLVRRSTDGGKTWSPQQVIWDDGPNTCGNPCVVVDRETGTIWLLSTWNRGDDHESKIKTGESKDTRRVFVTHSSDDGKTWAKPSEITDAVKRKTWGWYATGPGAGIQIERGPHKGRLVIPCDHSVMPWQGAASYRSHVIYSDDHGRTWRRGGSIEPGVNECEVVELTDGRLMINMRNYRRSEHRTRAIAFSADGGATWTEPMHAPTLIEPVCQVSIRRLRWPEGEMPGVILFSNPASTDQRIDMTIRASFDEGKTWKHARRLYDGGSAYSCLAILPDGRIACLFEADGYARIDLAIFPLAWVAGPQ